MRSSIWPGSARAAGTAAARSAVARTIVLIPVGAVAVGPQAICQITAAFAASANTLTLDRNDAEALRPGGTSIDGPEATEALNALERRHDTVLYIADPDLTPWSRKAVRQADLAILIGHHAGAPTITPLEQFAASVLTPAQTRLLLLHPVRGAVSGTSRWLAGRHVVMHHHMAGPDDAARLVRFVRGTALGLVAGGGGAFCVAHVGLYKALIEAGYGFDILGGTSGGSAMAAAFAMGSSPDEIDAAIAEMFVRQKAMRRYTWPRYGLIDHTHYDAQLAALCGGRAIEDLWVPFFSVSTNLSENRLHLHRSGLLWHAVRASSSIPALLPPFYTAEGDMLVDGGLIDNVPIQVMHDIKTGPNVVLSLEAPKLARYAVDYAKLPSRSALVRSLANPLRRGRLPTRRASQRCCCGRWWPIGRITSAAFDLRTCTSSRRCRRTWDCWIGTAIAS